MALVGSGATSSASTAHAHYYDNCKASFGNSSKKNSNGKAAVSAAVRGKHVAQEATIGSCRRNVPAAD
jgi:hypothetical protein